MTSIVVGFRELVNRGGPFGGGGGPAWGGGQNPPKGGGVGHKVDRGEGEKGRARVSKGERGGVRERERMTE